MDFAGSFTVILCQICQEPYESDCPVHGIDSMVEIIVNGGDDKTTKTNAQETKKNISDNQKVLPAAAAFASPHPSHQWQNSTVIDLTLSDDDDDNVPKPNNDSFLSHYDKQVSSVIRRRPQSVDSANVSKASDTYSTTSSRNESRGIVDSDEENVDIERLSPDESERVPATQVRKKFECNLCNKDCQNKRNYDHHMKKKHKKGLTASEPKSDKPKKNSFERKDIFSTLKNIFKDKKTPSSTDVAALAPELPPPMIQLNSEAEYDAEHDEPPTLSPKKMKEISPSKISPMIDSAPTLSPKKMNEISPSKISPMIDSAPTLSPKKMNEISPSKISPMIDSGRKSYSCLYCDQTFKTRGNLTMHDKHKHADKKNRKETTPVKPKSPGGNGTDHVSPSNPILDTPYTSITSDTFSCRVCQQQFEDKNGVLKHITKEHSKNSCLDCGLLFMTDVKLNDHLKSEHFNTRTMSCRTCNCSLSTVDALMEHGRKWHSISRRFSVSDDLLELVDVKKTVSRILCRICNKGFRNIDLYNRHSEIHLTPQNHPLAHRCQSCGHSFDTKKELKEHERIHLTSTPEKVDILSKLNCNSCNKVFDSSDALEQHSEIHRDKPSLKCTGCRHIFGHRYSLEVHEKRCSKLLLDSHPEKSALRKVGSSEQLDNPENVCFVCGITFDSSNDLARHRTESKHQERAPFPCPYCNQEFDIKSKLAEHVLTNLKNEYGRRWVSFIPGNNEQQHICQECGMFSLSEEIKEKHKNVHKGLVDRPYHCTICSASFKMRETVCSHISLVHWYLLDDTYKTKGAKFNCSEINKDKVINDLNPIEPDDDVAMDTDDDMPEESDMMSPGSSSDELYQCGICEVYFFDNETLDDHKIKSHNYKKRRHSGPDDRNKKKKKTGGSIVESDGEENEDCTCKVCGIEFSSKDILLSHQKLQKHFSLGPFKCELCDVPFQIKIFYLAHDIEHKKSKHQNNWVHHMGVKVDMYPCLTCGDSFASKNELDEHISIHVKSRLKSKVCEACNSGFVSTRALSLHIQDSHGHLLEDDPVFYEKTLNDLKINDEEQGEEFDIDEADVIKKDDGWICAKCGLFSYARATLRDHLRRHKSDDNKAHKCWFCEAEFTAEGTLTRHISTVHREKQRKLEIEEENDIIVCDHCPDSFETKTALKNHMRMEHSNVRLKCKQCCSSFLKQNDLNVHISKHVSISKTENVCNICKAGFQTSNGYHRHMQLYHKVTNSPGKGEFPAEGTITRHNSTLQRGKQRKLEIEEEKDIIVCDHCPDIFETKPALRDHIRMEHSNKRLKCKQCCSSFLNHRDLNLHTSKHVPISKTENVCNICKAGFQSVVGYHKHMLYHKAKNSPRKVPSSDDMKFNCKKCGAKFMTKDLVTRHIRVRHDQKFEFQCNNCKCYFDTKKGLIYHKSTACSKRKLQTNTKKCPICKMVLSDVHKLKRHVSAVHSNEKNKPFCCECGCSFEMKRTLDKHRNFYCALRMRNNSQTIDGAETKFVCECSRTFKSDQKLKMHKKTFCSLLKDKHKIKSIRNNKQVESCNLCGIEMESHNLLRHENTVHSGDPNRTFVCECSCAFANARHLEQHKVMRCFFSVTKTSKETEKTHRPKENLKLVSNANDTNICDICGMSVERRFIPRHKKQLHGSNPARRFVCECSCNFLNANSLKSHKLNNCALKKQNAATTETSKKQNAATTETLKKTDAATTKTLKKQNTATTETLKRFKCNDCGCKFLKKFNLEMHKKNGCRGITKVRKVKSAICPLCSAFFNNLSSMFKHLKSKHKEKRRYRCKYCESWAPLESIIEEHMQSCTSKDNDSKKHNSTSRKKLKSDKITPTDTSSKIQNSSSVDVEHDSTPRKKLKSDKSTPTNTPSKIQSSSAPKHILENMCPHCYKQFADHSRFQKHMNTHKKGGKHRCPYCNGQFPFLNKYEVHLQSCSKSESSHSKGVLEFQSTDSRTCNECGLQCITAQQLESHTRQHNSNLEFKCPNCMLHFHQKGRFISHVKNRCIGIKKDDPNVKCPTCKMSVLKNKYRDHFIKMHCKCRFCSRSFHQISMKKNHEESCDKRGSIDNQLTFCKSCDWTFITRDEYLNHQCDSDSTASTTCDVINSKKESHTSGNVINSKIESSKSDASTVNRKLVQWSCSGCEKTFATEPGLTRHIRVSHGGRRYLCVICREGFLELESLRTHEKTHETTSSHSCHVCSRTFRQYHHLIEHLRTHEDLHKPFNCSECSENFRTNEELSSHLLSHDIRSFNKSIKTEIIALDEDMSEEEHELDDNIQNTDVGVIDNPYENTGVFGLRISSVEGGLKHFGTPDRSFRNVIDERVTSKLQPNDLDSNVISAVPDPVTGIDPMINESTSYLNVQCETQTSETSSDLSESEIRKMLEKDLTPSPSFIDSAGITSNSSNVGVQNDQNSFLAILGLVPVTNTSAKKPVLSTDVDFIQSLAFKTAWNPLMTSPLKCKRKSTMLKNLGHLINDVVNADSMPAISDDDNDVVCPRINDDMNNISDIVPLESVKSDLPISARYPVLKEMIASRSMHQVAALPLLPQRVSGEFNQRRPHLDDVSQAFLDIKISILNAQDEILTQSVNDVIESSIEPIHKAKVVHLDTSTSELEHTLAVSYKENYEHAIERFYFDKLSYQGCNAFVDDAKVGRNYDEIHSIIANSMKEDVQKSIQPLKHLSGETNIDVSDQMISPKSEDQNRAENKLEMRNEITDTKQLSSSTDDANEKTGNTTSDCNKSTCDKMLGNKLNNTPSNLGKDDLSSVIVKTPFHDDTSKNPDDTRKGDTSQQDEIKVRVDQSNSKNDKKYPEVESYLSKAENEELEEIFGHDSNNSGISLGEEEFSFHLNDSSGDDTTTKTSVPSLVCISESTDVDNASAKSAETKKHTDDDTHNEQTENLRNVMVSVEDVMPKRSYHDDDEIHSAEKMEEGIGNQKPFIITNETLKPMISYQKETIVEVYGETNDAKGIKDAMLMTSNEEKVRSSVNKDKERCDLVIIDSKHKELDKRCDNTGIVLKELPFTAVGKADDDDGALPSSNVAKENRVQNNEELGADVSIKESQQSLFNSEKDTKFQVENKLSYKADYHETIATTFSIDKGPVVTNRNITKDARETLSRSSDFSDKIDNNQKISEDSETICDPFDSVTRKMALDQFKEIASGESSSDVNLVSCKQNVSVKAEGHSESTRENESDIIGVKKECEFTERDKTSIPVPKILYKCGTCGISFNSKYNLVSHHKTHAVNDNTCKICKKTFAMHSTLKFHMKSHKKKH